MANRELVTAMVDQLAAEAGALAEGWREGDLLVVFRKADSIRRVLDGVEKLGLADIKAGLVNGTVKLEG